MKYLIFLLMLCGTSTPNKEIYVDLIELNHVRNKVSGFDQIILWKEYPYKDRSEFRAISFEVLDDQDKTIQHVTKTGKFYSVPYKYTTAHGFYYVKVISTVYRESWSHDDPERESFRKHWQKEDCPEFFKDPPSRKEEDAEK